MLERVFNYLGKVVRRNTGVSSISLALVMISIMSIVMLMVICICMLVEVFYTKTINASLDGYAAIITAVAGLITAVGLPKAINNYGEHKYNKDV